ncbi:MAG: FKBP-type peptidyl-prolyl cis-trans isomerase [Proteobacteria bacterium]|nr:FKBP-type peptidyl-prolyl cis-trans isomerase [Pseudomonadota bacterium]
MKIEKNKISYVLGQSIGGDFKRNGYDIDIDIFIDSFREAYGGMDCRMPVAEMRHIMMNFQQYIREDQQKKQMAAVEKNLIQGNAFLEENRKKENVITTESGLQYKILRKGSGKKPLSTDDVVTHYEGKTIDGKIFDSSYKRGTPASFPVSGVIKGWQEVLQLMEEGAKWEIFVPSDLAYGQAGSGGTIEPHSTLIFTIELIAVQ